jgi:hypothetical protein
MTSAEILVRRHYVITGVFLSVSIALVFIAVGAAPKSRASANLNQANATPSSNTYSSNPSGSTGPYSYPSSNNGSGFSSPDSQPSLPSGSSTTIPLYGGPNLSSQSPSVNSSNLSGLSPSRSSSAPSSTSSTTSSPVTTTTTFACPTGQPSSTISYKSDGMYDSNFEAEGVLTNNTSASIYNVLVDYQYMHQDGTTGNAGTYVGGYNGPAFGPGQSESWTDSPFGTNYDYDSSPIVSIQVVSISWQWSDGRYGSCAHGPDA